MTLEERLDQDLESTLRKRDAVHRSVIQMIRSQILLEKKKGGKSGEIDDARVVRMVQVHAGKIKDSLALAQKVGRSDLVDQARRELEITESYLPPPLSDEELGCLVREAVDALTERGPRAMGAAMKAIMGRVEGRADGKRVQEAVREALK